MCIETKKPKLTSSQLISKMADKGITFDYFGEDEAADYLLTHNNYLRLSSYRKNYETNKKGINKDKYISLDFAYLKDLAIIDMLLRQSLLKMCIDIEHSLKVSLLANLEDSDNDGYSIVRSFLSDNPYIVEKIWDKIESQYVGELVSKYFVKEVSGNPCDIVNSVGIGYTLHLPVWVILEVLDFGDFIKFYKHYYINNSGKPVEDNIMMCVKSLRNACAHNNCILCNLRRGGTHSCDKIDKFLERLELTTSSTRDQLSCRVKYEIVCILYVYNQVVSKNVKKHGLQNMKQLVDVIMPKNKSFYEKNQIILSSYNFLKVLLDNLMLLAYNNNEIEKA